MSAIERNFFISHRERAKLWEIWVEKESWKLREERTLMVEREREREREFRWQMRREGKETSNGWEERWTWEKETLDDKRILIIIKKIEYEYLNKIKGRIDNLFF